jgi:hypothetical protein
MRLSPVYEVCVAKNGESKNGENKNRRSKK